MKGKSKGWGKEKIISAIVACAVILTLRQVFIQL